MLIYALWAFLPVIGMGLGGGVLGYAICALQRHRVHIDDAVASLNLWRDIDPMAFNSAFATRFRFDGTTLLRTTPTLADSDIVCGEDGDGSYFTILGLLNGIFGRGKWQLARVMETDGKGEVTNKIMGFTKVRTKDVIVR